MSNEIETELTASQVRLKKNGDLVQRIEGAEVLVAHYDQSNGRLEFTTKANAEKLYNQVTARIGTVSKGTESSGLTIKSIGVKGDPIPSGNLPKKPRMGELGDATPEGVEWYFEHNLSEAIIRYGVFTDANGKPIRKNVRRIVESTIDQRDTPDDDIEWVKTGNKTRDKSPVSRTQELITEKNAIIARRATHMTFTPNEVVGGFVVDEDGQPDGGDE